MRDISSHRDHRGSKMRFLIVSAVLACAAAAPSHLLAPVALAGVYPAVIPTLSPGDVQAAAIDAQVKAQDLAIAAIDKNRELSEQANENVKTEVFTGTDLVKESAQEAFWSVQEKQWQALDALKTAEAQIDGAIASNAPALAKTALVGPYVPVGAVGPIAPISPISPIVYTPGIIAPAVKTVAEPAVEEAKPEAKPEVTEEKNEALTKTAEEKVEDKDSVAVEASKVNLEAKSQLAPVFTTFAIQPYGYPIVAPLALSPVLKYGAFPQVGLAPTIVKTGW